jgi:hypothetical protein
VEEILRRSMGSLESESSRRAATTARRSFFRRKKHRDSKELASFANTELGCWSDSGALADDPPLLSYQRVERLHCTYSDTDNLFAFDLGTFCRLH